ncbi:Glutamine-binding periplasmic protein [Sulfitobacter indolifex]|uniref:Extracellular solute-binding protein, family 3 n=1 Tax=Sulfitobacter indolifex HEL-45 TaxID=391624 RepID=A0ABP2DBT3_9RHOB|nr:ABC transporter substrate-binding protein [Sulfitobacter indolifex]EDQ05770.1 extracellular solute-binding protein, family 3 [Sulfitobacter indolifex HEL-45]UOA19941.1 Glutamine-binding periplasmic protein [Sulfitobacter indolifex]
MNFITSLKNLRVIALAVGLSAAAMEPAMAQDLKVGSTPTGVPFTFLNVETNQIDGIMVDIMKAIAEEEGFDVEINATQWSALIPSLTGGKISIIAAAMYATPERAEVVSFSETVYSYGEGLFVKSDNETAYSSVKDMEGLTVGVQVGTSYKDALEASGRFDDIKVYDSIADIMRDVALGRIDAGFGDYPIVAYQLAKGTSEVRLVQEYEALAPGNVAIAVRKDDTELLGKINNGLKSIRENGELDKILVKWGL